MRRAALAMVMVAAGVTCGVGSASAQIPRLPEPPPPFDVVWDLGVPGTQGEDLPPPFCPPHDGQSTWNCEFGVQRAHCSEAREYYLVSADGTGTGYARCTVDAGVVKAECTEYQPTTHQYGNVYQRRCEVRNGKGWVLAECYEYRDSIIYPNYDRGCRVGKVGRHCHRPPFGPQQCRWDGIPPARGRRR